jgi:hypothetical protein
MNSGSGYNEISHELLADSGIGGGIAVGARRPELAKPRPSYGAVGYEVSPATTFAAFNSSRLQWNCAD